MQLEPTARRRWLILCSTIEKQEYADYTEREKQEFSESRTLSQAWWSRSRELLEKKTKPLSIPELKRTNGNWAHEPIEKATLIAETKQKKLILPDEVCNEFTEIPHCGKTQTEIQMPTDEPIEDAMKSSMKEGRLDRMYCRRENSNASQRTSFSP